MNASQTLSRIEGFVTTINPALDIVVTTILIFLLGFILGKILGKLIHWALKQLNLDLLTKKYLKLNIPLQKYLSTTITYFIYIATVYIGLERLRVVGYVFYILLGAVLIFTIMSFLTTIKDFFPNVVAGIYLKRKRFFNIDDHISFPGIKGKVTALGLLSTEILTTDNEHIIIPNSAFKKNVIKVKKSKNNN